MPIIRIGWWNTSLNPPRVNRKRSKLTSVVCQTINKLLDEVDILFLGEIKLNNSVCKAINQYNKKQNANSSRCFLVDARRTETENNPFRTLCIYDQSKVSFDSTCEVRDWRRVSKDKYSCYYRIGQRYDFILPAPLSRTSFYVAHWSQYSEEDGEFMKVLAANCLRTNMSDYDSLPIVCLGDFNSEPHARALAVLGASRSVEYIKLHSGFHNGWWQFLGHDTGSINYENRRFLKTQNPLFDQILINRQIVAKTKSCDLEVTDDCMYKPSPSQHRPVLLSLY